MDTAGSLRAGCSLRAEVEATSLSRRWELTAGLLKLGFPDPDEAGSNPLASCC